MQSQMKSGWRKFSGEWKKAGTKGWSRHQCWLVARINWLLVSSFRFLVFAGDDGLKHHWKLETLKLKTESSASSRPHRQIPHLRQDARHLHPI